MSALHESEVRHGTKIGRFVVIAELGSGGMGVVYAAHDPQLDRQVALKVMRDASVELEDRMRMLREGQAMARVIHANVITVYEVGEQDGIVFLAQELLDGGSLAKWLETPREQYEIIEKFVAAGRGLAAAHAAKLVHRDFKPDNVLLGTDGRVRVSDFGIARLGGVPDHLVGPTNPGGGPPRTDVDVTRNNQLTKTGAVMGTPMFMAPEQHEGKRADERSDQFAFCVALYHALYGEWPYEGKTAVSLADNVINGVMAPPPKTKAVPERLRKILLRGLATNPEDRFPSMEALLAELTAPPAKSKVPFLVGGLVLALGAGAAVFVLLAREPEKKPVVDEPKPDPIVVKDLTSDHAENLTNALYVGQLDNARMLYDKDAALTQAHDKAIAQAASAFLSAVRGDLVQAEATLREADANKGTDVRAGAYADLARAQIAASRGGNSAELKSAREAALRCAESFNATKPAEPVMASMCRHIVGDVAADVGDPDAARQAYEAGLLLAKQKENAERMRNLSLAIAQLGFDEKHHEFSLDTIKKLQKEARRDQAVSCEASAAVLASRLLLAQGESNKALEVFEDIDPNKLQAYRTKLIAKIAVGQIYGYLNQGDDDGVTGLDRINDAIDEAKKREHWGLVLEGQLARVRVLITIGDPKAEEERAALISDAKNRGYLRIARLAEAHLPEEAEQKPVEKPSDVPPPDAAP